MINKLFSNFYLKDDFKATINVDFNGKLDQTLYEDIMMYCALRSLSVDDFIKTCAIEFLRKECK